MRIGIDASRAFVENPTGTERYSYEIITRILKLPEAKKHTWILYVKSKVQDSRFKVQSNVQIKEISMKYLWTQVGLAWRTWTDNLDVLWVPAHTLPVLRRPGMRTVVTIHGIEYEWLPAYENWLQRWYLPLSTQYAVKSATKIVAVSKFTKKQLVERLGADADKIEVVHEGVSLYQTINKHKLVRKKYIMCVGTIQPRKNLVRLIEAFSRLKNKDLKLVIVGKWGWMYEDVMAAPEKFRVKGRVIFTGYTNEKEKGVLLAESLVYVQPSVTEGFGLPVLEAMVAGVPVVSSNGGALSEVVGEAGLLFDPYDINDMAKQLSVAISNNSLRLVLMKRGYERIKEFSWDLAAERTYNTLISSANF